MKVSSGIYQSVLGYADSITAASSAQSEMTGAPNERQTSPDSGAQTAPTTHPAHERLSFEHPFSNSSFRTAFFQAPAPSSVPSRAPPLSALLRASSFNCSRLQRALLRKICKNIQESTPSYPRTIFPQVNDKGTPDSLHALNGVFLQNNKRSLFMRHSACCFLQNASLTAYHSRQTRFPFRALCFPSGYCRLSPLTALFQ